MKEKRGLDILDRAHYLFNKGIVYTNHNPEVVRIHIYTHRRSAFARVYLSSESRYYYVPKFTGVRLVQKDSQGLVPVECNGRNPVNMLGNIC